ncbi:hypothetical protein Holit_01550 [Hollandina sp. SP2]
MSKSIYLCIMRYAYIIAYNYFSSIIQITTEINNAVFAELDISYMEKFYIPMYRRRQRDSYSKRT